MLGLRFMSLCFRETQAEGRGLPQGDTGLDFQNAFICVRAADAVTAFAPFPISREIVKQQERTEVGTCEDGRGRSRLAAGMKRNQKGSLQALP